MSAQRISTSCTAAFILTAFCCVSALAQEPVTVPPTMVDPSHPIVVKTSNPPKSNKKGSAEKFQGFVMHANIAQITVRAKGNDLAIRTFPLSQNVSVKMQQIVDNGGYQYGDKVTIFYDPVTQQALKIKGKPSKPI